MSRAPRDFPAWCEREFYWDHRDTEEVPVKAREVFEDLDFAHPAPAYARHPDLGWMVVTSGPDGRRIFAYTEASPRHIRSAIRLWAD